MGLKEGITAALEAVVGSEKVHPLHASEGEAPPYVVYVCDGEENQKDLNGYTDMKTTSFEINLLHGTYDEMTETGAEIDEALKALQGTTCGGILIQDISVDENSPEVYENEIDLYRKIFNVKIIS